MVSDARSTENDYTLVCHDGRRPTDLSRPHGVHHWQMRLPVSRRWHLCLTLTSGRYFVPMVERRDGVLRAALPFAAVALVRRTARLSASYMRWCGHVDVTVEHRFPPAGGEG